MKVCPYESARVVDGRNSHRISASAWSAGRRNPKTPDPNQIPACLGVAGFLFFRDDTAVEIERATADCVVDQDNV